MSDAGKARRAVFLEEMNLVAPWGAVRAGAAHYPRRVTGVGRKTVRNWFNLSDRVVEEAHYDSLACAIFQH